MKKRTGYSRNGKIVFTLAIAALMLFGVCRPCEAYAAGNMDRGVDGKIEWTIYNDTLTLSAVEGTDGKMEDYIDRTAPWIASERAGSVKKIVVQKGVRRLGSASLGFDHVVDTVVIAGTVESIDTRGPVGWNIRILKFEEGVRSIQEFSFGKGISYVYFPESISYVNVHAFGGPGKSGWEIGIKKVFGFLGTAVEKYVDDVMSRVVYARSQIPGALFKNDTYSKNYDTAGLSGAKDYIFLVDAASSEFAELYFSKRVRGDASEEDPDDGNKKRKQKQTIKISSKINTTLTYTTTHLQKQSTSFKIAAKAKGKITYKVTKGDKKYISVTKKGKVTLKKGCKRGTYQITVSAAPTSKYLAAKKVITVKVKKPKKKKDPLDRLEDNSGFLKYVYTNAEGLVCFRYTGIGEKRIIIPEGVHVVEGFSDSLTAFNDEITYIYIPSTVTKIYGAGIFYKPDYGWDTGTYSVLYQCRNLSQVEISPDSLQFQVSADGQKIYELGGGYIWSNSQRLPLQ